MKKPRASGGAWSFEGCPEDTRQSEQPVTVPLPVARCRSDARRMAGLRCHHPMPSGYEPLGLFTAIAVARYGIDQKTVAKWKKRGSVCDHPTGPKEPRSTVLTVEEEAMVVAFRRHTLLPLDDCLYALQPTIPRLTRSSLHRCLQRHGISRLPQVEGEASPKRKFKAYPIGYFHIDIAEVRTAQGKLYLLVAIDRTSKFAFVELHEKVARSTAADFLRRLIEAVPYRVHTVLTDNGTHLRPQRYRSPVDIPGRTVKSSG
jgi:hypothetical protein